MEKNSLQIFRKKFGISQSNLAVYLSISLSLLKMIETNKRELPSAAFLKFTYLQTLAVPSARNEEIHSEVRINKGINKSLKEYIKQYQYLLPKLKKQLQSTKTKYEQATNLFNLLNKLENTPDTTNAGKEYILWIEMMQAHTTIQLNKYGIEVQRVLQWKIDTYTYNLQRAKELNVI